MNFVLSSHSLCRRVVFVYDVVQYAVAAASRRNEIFNLSDSALRLNSVVLLRRSFLRLFHVIYCQPNTTLHTSKMKFMFARSYSEFDSCQNQTIIRENGCEIKFNSFVIRTNLCVFQFQQIVVEPHEDLNRK